MNREVDKFKCSLGAHPSKILKIDEDLEIKICKVCNKILEEHWCIRCRVAYNKNTPPEILVKLLKDEHWNVRWSVTQNPNTPSKILKKLSKDKEWIVRSCVTQHSNTPIKVLEELLKDKNWHVRKSAKIDLKNRK